VKDSLYVGEGPFGESCPQVGDDGYSHRGRAHCVRFIEQIRSCYGLEPAGARLFVKSNPHDFGTYFSVECEFDDDRCESVEYAFAVEGDFDGVLEYWTSEDGEVLV